ncbi:MAG TPA: SDR family oxidoreductase [Acidimicrobiia bacterium]|nr:SDR family oxidoreductase [Acidimicrobiia bacterium]
MDLQGRVVVVTGGGNGIGAAMARRLAAEGARVAIGDLALKQAGRVAAEVGGVAVETDVAREDDVVRLIEVSEAQLGPIDLFCANAGIAFAGDEQTPDADWERMWRVNFLSHVYAARHLVPRWQTRGGGYLLVTASAAGLLTNLGAAQYTVTKHAAVAWAEWLSITYAQHGIKVSCLCPQGVDTAMLEQAGLMGEVLRATALSPEQVAAAVVEGLKAERFLILPHPEVAEYLLNKASDHERWLEGMRRLNNKVFGTATMEE